MIGARHGPAPAAPPLPPPHAELQAVVVVPARDEAARIGACLRALRDQQGVGADSFELMVVLDGCGDGTLELVREAAGAAGQPRVHAVVLAQRHGVGRARRLGMDIACERLLRARCGERGLIASTDADSTVAPDWLRAQLELAQAGAEAIGGLIELDAGERAALHPHALVLRERSAERRLRVAAGQGAGVPLEHHHFSGASLALTVGAYVRCGGLPVRAALEDEALARSLAAQGVAIHRSADVRVRTSARTDSRAPRGLGQDLARADWRARRSFAAGEFSLEGLLAAKRETISLVLPAREVAGTIGSIAQIAARLLAAGLLDEALVVDADSADGTAAVARRCGLRVAQESELLCEHGRALGKGDAMWRGLAATRGEIVVFADTDTEDFHEGFLLGLIGPLLREREVQLVKGAFRRPFRSGAAMLAHGGGRVTELMARPLLNLHAPELTVFEQPLAGETAARRALLERLPFSAGYGVEIAMLIDAWRAVGMAGLAQVDLGTRQNRHQPLRELSAMAYAVLVAAQSRFLGQQLLDAHACESIFLAAGEDEASGERRRVTIEERPPLLHAAPAAAALRA